MLASEFTCCCCCCCYCCWCYWCCWCWCTTFCSVDSSNLLNLPPFLPFALISRHHLPHNVHSEPVSVTDDTTQRFLVSDDTRQRFLVSDHTTQRFLLSDDTTQSSKAGWFHCQTIQDKAQKPVRVSETRWRRMNNTTPYVILFTQNFFDVVVVVIVVVADCFYRIIFPNCEVN